MGLKMLTVPRYFTSIFVSLGVFLFGYDQGVMSGIITLVGGYRVMVPY